MTASDLSGEVGLAKERTDPWRSEEVLTDISANELLLQEAFFGDEGPMDRGVEDSASRARSSQRPLTESTDAEELCLLTGALALESMEEEEAG